MEKPAQPLSLPRPGGVLGIFAKQPIAGQVKTRLCPPLTPAQACRLYRTALDETVARLTTFDELTPVLCHTGAAAWFRDRYPGVPLLAQATGNLGQRLEVATAALAAAGGRPVLLVGSDSPDLPPALVAEALAALTTQDLVTIPCRDGGYALIGQRRPQPGIFRDMPWSSPRLLAATRQRCRELGLAYREIGAWDDLDDLAALQRLLARSPGSQTAAFVRDHLDGLVRHP